MSIDADKYRAKVPKLPIEVPQCTNITLHQSQYKFGIPKSSYDVQTGVNFTTYQQPYGMQNNVPKRFVEREIDRRQKVTSFENKIKNENDKIPDLNKLVFQLDPLKTGRPREQTVDHYSTLRPLQQEEGTSLQPVDISIN